MSRAVAMARAVQQTREATWTRVVDVRPKAQRTHGEASEARLHDAQRAVGSDGREAAEERSNGRAFPSDVDARGTSVPTERIALIGWPRARAATCPGREEALSFSL